jgi:deoxyribonuclease-1
MASKRAPSRRKNTKQLTIGGAIAAAAVLVLQYFGWLPMGESNGKTSAPSQTEVKLDLAGLPKSPGSFGTSKDLLYEQVYKGHEVTFYCGCKFDPKTRVVDMDSCGLQARKNEKRSSQLEAEHVFPAEWFGNFRECWRNPAKVCGLDSKGEKISGRKCCEKSDPVFETAHNDLHNLFPAEGEVNGDRSNFNWGEIPGEKREYGQCNMEVDASIRRAEPPEKVKGDIARVMFYMEKIYRFKLSDQDRQLFNAWAKQDPVDSWEIERNRRIAKIQGVANPFIGQ